VFHCVLWNFNNYIPFVWVVSAQEFLVCQSMISHVVCCWCAVVGELKPANQLINPQAADAAVAGAGGNVHLGATSSNCGLTQNCLPDEFSVHLFSGKENLEGPRMCINGN